MSTDLAERQTGGAVTSLRRNELGFAEVLFQGLASAAPGLSVTLAVIVGASFAGGALPLALIFALVGMLLVGACIGQMSRRFPSAGGFYTFASRGLHPAAGPLVAWLYLIVWMVFPSTLFLPFGSFVADTFNDWWGWDTTIVWIVFAMICLAIIWRIVYAGARLSTNVGIVLGGIEFLVLGVLSLWLIAEAGGANTLTVFGTEHANAEGFSGSTAIFGGMVFAIFGFVGFENAVPLGEEAKNPHRSVTRVSVLAPLILGLFIIFCTYAAVVYFGPDRFATFPSFNDGNAWIGLAKDVWGDAWYVLLVMLLNSCVASANGATIAATRHLYAMGRNSLLPRQLARVDSERGTPRLALACVMVVSVCVTLAAGLATGTPLEGFAFLGTIEVATAILLYTIVALSCLGYFLRARPEGFNPLLHVVVPVLAIAVMIPALMTSVGVGSGIFEFISPLPYPLDVAGFIAFGWLIAGIVFASYQWSRHPDRARATERVFVDAPEPQPA
jgi:amino acid transporter